ncbi:MAG: 50S ribosomal protein L21 [bacterium (Candidatus Ratteibacteria) CG_4_10_14_3_um_filter_41_18]|uniref:Large ribosomal subunit protein bL21 n=3 Tax=Candidatus Ratteibacteria TaxID=2979319 RepID=A0A2M7E9S0_9BACT|nr:MAG: 50S ribosomal protein L21 [Candidatus Omnitrophica bacterium CG1_02_41_171]PIV64487.1 MAG: 50S ribosomal protein L21 [bacterium (Candidatus Ratteibacteria) CG01_land_8_20_14_3_00_40_19]PIW74567.1 MAG: 50S ribosomal protein L21 [bacterium (Candidatus Ratteibacteria) CG_4_8_14_3_um_filter_41_36]PIX77734.1 MAG: 50S ribosomal protein L21 [bacterium (Candidatus Ratteibacteria) CG_4_10_14_3_um_filter_41_18]PJA61397.1 MAG: 50S ribosomal protein L21 [bacterium (Candidatus Ratteibacteria) CG_4_9
MYAIVKFKGKQYKIKEGEEFDVDRIDAQKGDKVSIDDILFLSPDNQEPLFSQENLKKTKVLCEVLKQGKGKKEFSFKTNSRTNYKRKIGFRPSFTKLKVLKIEL